MNDNSYHPLPHEDVPRAGEWHHGNMRASQRALGAQTPLTVASTTTGTSNTTTHSHNEAPGRDDHDDDDDSFEDYDDDKDADDDSGWEGEEDDDDDWSDQQDDRAPHHHQQENSTVHTNELYYDHNERQQQLPPEQAPPHDFNNNSHEQQYASRHGSSRSGSSEGDGNYDDYEPYYVENNSQVENFDEEDPLRPPNDDGDNHDMNNPDAEKEAAAMANTADRGGGGGRNPAFVFFGCLFLCLAIVFAILAIVYRDAKAPTSPPTYQILTPPPQSMPPGTGTAAPRPGTGTAEVLPIVAPTLSAGSNPVVTPKPESQKGTLGPTSQVVTGGEFGQTFSPAPTPAPPTQRFMNSVESMQGVCSEAQLEADDRAACLTACEGVLECCDPYWFGSDANSSCFSAEQAGCVSHSKCHVLNGLFYGAPNNLDRICSKAMLEVNPEECQQACSALSCCYVETESCVAHANFWGACLDYAPCQNLKENSLIEVAPKDLDERCKENAPSCTRDCKEAEECCSDPNSNCYRDNFLACLSYSACTGHSDTKITVAPLYSRVTMAPNNLQDVCSTRGLEERPGECEEGCAAASCCWQDGAASCFGDDPLGCIEYQICTVLGGSSLAG